MLIGIRDLAKDSRREFEVVRALDGVGLDVDRGAFVTHDEGVARNASRVVRWRDGRIESDTSPDSGVT